MSDGTATTRSGSVSAKNVLEILALSVVIIGAILGGILWVADVRNDAREAREQIKKIQETQPPQNGGFTLTKPHYELSDIDDVEQQKQDLADRLSNRVNPILQGLHEGQVVTSLQIDEMRRQVAREIREVVLEEQKQNEGLRRLLSEAQESRSHLQSMLDSEQAKNHDLQERLLSTYGTAESSLQMANELRMLYVQVAKQDSSVLGTALETVKTPFKLIGNALDGDILDSKKMEAREQDLRLRFERLCSDLQSCNPRRL